MSDICHALVLNMHQPPGNLEDLLGHAEWEVKEILWAYDRVPRSLWAYEDVARVHLSMSGTLLRNLVGPGVSKPRLRVNGLRQLLGTCQNERIIKILGTGYYHPVMALIPPADWDQQLRRWQGIAGHLFGGRHFTGFWPPRWGSAWS